MKILDAKNRLFGKLHIGIILSVIGILCTIILGLTIVNTKPDYVVVRVKGSPGNWWWATPRPPDWLALSLHKGDKEYNSLNQPIAEVLGVNVYDAGGSTKDVYLTVRLNARKNKSTNKYKYKGESLDVGGPITLNLNNTFFPGIVTEISTSDIQSKKTYKPIEVLMKIPDKWPWELDGLKIGDTMSDGAGSAIATVKNIESYPAEKEVFTDSGQLVKAYSPVKKDFYVILTLLVIQSNNEYVFREEQYIKVGNGLWIQFPLYNINGYYASNPDGAIIQRVTIPQ